MNNFNHYYDTETTRQVISIVVMNEQLIVDTKHLYTKEEKGTHVYNSLLEVAQNSQKDINPIPPGLRRTLQQYTVHTKIQCILSWRMVDET